VPRRTVKKASYQNSSTHTGVQPGFVREDIKAAAAGLHLEATKNNDQTAKATTQKYTYYWKTQDFFILVHDTNCNLMTAWMYYYKTTVPLTLTEPPPANFM
jgi:hypothetical protein